MMIGYLEYVRIPADTKTTAAAGAPPSAKSPAAQTPLSLTPKALGVLGRRLDANKDNKVSREEAGPAFAALHQRLDKNQDGYVTAEEAKAASTAP
jgi:hypothetical protein